MFTCEAGLSRRGDCHRQIDKTNSGLAILATPWAGTHPEREGARQAVCHVTGARKPSATLAHARPIRPPALTRGMAAKFPRSPWANPARGSRAAGHRRGPPVARAPGDPGSQGRGRGSPQRPRPGPRTAAICLARTGGPANTGTAQPLDMRGAPRESDIFDAGRSNRSLARAVCGKQRFRRNTARQNIKAGIFRRSRNPYRISLRIC